jgi:hypothetical protein
MIGIFALSPFLSMHNASLPKATTSRKVTPVSFQIIWRFFSTLLGG